VRERGVFGGIFGIMISSGYFLALTVGGWLLAHFSGMIAAYVSAVTAFVVINAHDIPMMVRWIVPSTAGGAVIVALTLQRISFHWPRRTPATIAGEPVASATATDGRFVLH